MSHLIYYDAAYVVAWRVTKVIEHKRSIEILTAEQKKAQARGDSCTENLIMLAIESMRGHTAMEHPM